MLNWIWISFFGIAGVAALFQWGFGGHPQIFAEMMQAVFQQSRLAFEISLGLVGVMTFWLGIMRVGEKGGFLETVIRFFSPLLRQLFPHVPSGHPALGAMLSNLSANFLGLDNAATPLGLKAMKELQKLNNTPETASDAQVLFLVLNTSSVTLFPVTIFVFRAQQGAADPTDVFLPILFATFMSTLVGFLSVAWFQKIRLWNATILTYVGGLILLMAALLMYFLQLDTEQMKMQSAFLSNFLIFTLILLFIGGAARRRVDVYEAFIEGAQEGFQVAVKIIPYLVAMLVGIGVFRASGALEYALEWIRLLLGTLGWDVRFVDSLPTAMMRPLSGSGSRGLMVDTMQQFGADSFAGRLACLFQGSTETTFYVLALYFGSVGIRKARHAVICGLLADFAGILTAIGMAYLFFG